MLRKESKYFAETGTKRFDDSRRYSYNVGKFPVMTSLSRQKPAAMLQV